MAKRQTNREILDIQACSWITATPLKGYCVLKEKNSGISQESAEL